MSTTLNRVRRTINRHRMLRPDDRIAVAVSGGKDSAVLLDVLCRIEEKFPRAELVPFTVDEGIRGYRDAAIDCAKALVMGHGLTLRVFSFEELFGITLDTLVARRPPHALGACSYCGVLRRRAMNHAATVLQADVVATGHIMDDETQTVLMNLLRGDPYRIARNYRPRSRPVPGLVSRVKPIMELSERDVVAYAHHLSLSYHSFPCPYAAEAYRSDVRRFLNHMEHRHPGTMLAVLHSAESIAAALNASSPNMSVLRCERCGAPTSVSVCKVCSILDSIRSW